MSFPRTVYRRLRSAFFRFSSRIKYASYLVVFWFERRAGIARLVRAYEDKDVVGIGARAVGRSIVMLVVSDLRIDPRVEREARALAKAGYTITVICPDPTEGKTSNLALDWGPGVTIDFISSRAAAFLATRPGYLGYELFDRAMSYQPFAYHAHDLNTAYAARAVARVKGAHLVVDFHEWSSENVHWDVKSLSHKPYPDQWKSELQALERACLEDATAVVTVCNSIANALVQEFNAPRAPTVVRNIPDITTNPTRSYAPLKQQLGLSEHAFVLLWQGGTGPTRLIEPIIEALAFAPKCTFVIRGPSLDIFGESYMALARSINAAHRLVLASPVPSKDVVVAAVGADAGIWTLPNLCRNFTFALPNKIFEYMASGLPVLAANYPEAAAAVKDNGAGLVFDPYDPQSIADAINRLVGDPDLRKLCAVNASRTVATYSSLEEWNKLVDIYDKLIE